MSESSIYCLPFYAKNHELDETLSTEPEVVKRTSRQAEISVEEIVKHIKSTRSVLP